MKQKIGWEQYRAIINWLVARRKKDQEAVFVASDLKKRFGCQGREANNRIKQLHRWGIIEPTGIKGLYKVSPSIDKEKLKSIHGKYIPNGGRLQLVNFKGEELTLKEIYERENPGVSLNYFTTRIRRGWTVEMALMPSSKKC